MTPARPGKAVFLTIDHKIQANAEQVLRDTVKKWGAKSATAIVLDPKTGAVLAMAEAPSYDANKFPTVAAKFQRNHAVSDFFEPGSVFKVVTIAGALSRASRHAADEVHAPVLDPGRRPAHSRRGAARRRRR